MSIIEVLANDTFAAQMSLSGLDEIASVTQLGVRLRVLIPESVGQPLELIESALRKKGVDAQSALVPASLEDVFVAVTYKDTAKERAA
jgi:ABC-2 type transport system ATP-binding protein